MQEESLFVQSVLTKKSCGSGFKHKIINLILPPPCMVSSRIICSARA